MPMGTGSIKINGRDIDDYFGLETLKLIVRQPMELTDTMGRFDIECNVTGGGHFRAGRRHPSWFVQSAFTGQRRGLPPGPEKSGLSELVTLV